ncbi:cation-translocating P-type ATPase [Galbibacter sp. PAP.153]|uniref:heavy metal translocating P-type ATPase n=1 Tax=Galbibacter sp. PAP.153 TaxID=3104623 RepID=UPI0030085C40
MDSEKNIEKVTFKIKGLCCADEEVLLKRTFKKLKGVQSFEVNLTNQLLNISFNPSLLTRDKIIASISKTGMTAITDTKLKRTVNYWKDTRTILLFISFIVAVIGFGADKLHINPFLVKIIYAIAIVVGGIIPVKKAIASLRKFILTINTLLVVATIGAVSLGLWEEAAILVVIFSLGEVLESYAVDKARGSIKALMDLSPQTALVRRNGEEIMIPVEQIEIGDYVIIKPGERIPMDGKILSGASSVDQSPITGESIPVAKETGDTIFAGTINQRGSLEIEVTKLAKDTTLARIIHSVETAQSHKSTYQHFGERFGKIYTPVMFVVAFLTATVPTIFFNQPFSEWFYKGLILLVVSCSCGLVLSVPVAVIAAIGNAAKNGILIKGGAYFEAMNGVNCVAFDKTGTLTLGQPYVTDIIPLGPVDDDTLLAIAATIESRSEHPLADAILRYATTKDIKPDNVIEFESITGMGAKAKVNGQTYLIGNKRLFGQTNYYLKIADEKLIQLETEGKTAMLIGNEKDILGIIAVADKIRPQAKETIQLLKSLGVKKTIMLTGDNERTASYIASQLGIDEYRAHLLPEEKVNAIKELKKDYGKVAMVGDGVNDAPAMALADLGIAMGGIGTDVAMETGDVVLMGDDLSKLPIAFSLSNRTIANIKQNIFISIALVFILILAALFGLVDLVSGLIINEASALVVIANGLRLYKLKILL